MASDHLHQLEPSVHLPTFHLPRRLLLQTTGAATPDPTSLDSDVVLILAALLCALICVVGLAMAARCAWLRRAVVAAATPAAITTNKGLKKKAIRALPKLAFSPAHRAKLPFSDCPICLADFDEGDEVRILPRCAHAFHVPCIDTWLASHSSCPSCRQNLAAKPSAKQVAAETTAAESTAAAGGAEGAGSLVVAVAVTGPPSPGVGRCRWCGAGGSAVADADDGREHGGKGRDEGHDNQYLP